MGNHNKVLNFIGLGAQKAGTTSLHSIFRAHPEIFVPVVTKEPHFFDNEVNYGTGFPQYIQDYFAELTDELAIGEITPSLLCASQARDRIFDTLGKDVKFIVMFRHPVRRAISHYKMNLNWLWETEEFESAIGIEKTRASGTNQLRFNYFGRGEYLDQISHYLEVFDLDQFHFILFEELIADHQRVLSKCFDFLGVRSMNIEEFPHANQGRKTELLKFDNPTAIKINQNGRESEVLIPKGGWVLNTDFHGRLRVIKKPPAILRDRLEKVKHLLEQATPDRLRIDDLYQSHFAHQEKELQDLTGLNLSLWSQA